MTTEEKPHHKDKQFLSIFQDSSKSNKNVLSKRLRARVVKDGLEEVLGLLEADQQTACLEALEVKDKSGTAKSIAVRLAGGMLTLFSFLPI